ncbi:MAG: IS4 family transposase [Prochloraceae cyanobacterium]|nr:IS4 family transposase [Prochloraceae cyanobacterium]
MNFIVGTVALLKVLTVLQYQCQIRLRTRRLIHKLVHNNVGCGFPLAKIGVLFSYATGAVMGIAIDIFNTHDINLARELTKYLEAGDILLGDRAFCAYSDICLWIKQGCDVVVRLHQARLLQGSKKPKYTVDPPFKKKKKTRKELPDRLIYWTKPKQKPDDISQEDFDSLPEDLVLREVHCYICIPGFRTKEITVVTTLLDAIEYPGSEILKLYDARWETEVNLRHIKTTLGMDILSCKTPEMVRKEVYAYLLAYNLLRTIMYRAGTRFNRNHMRLSLQASRQHLKNLLPKLENKTQARREKLYKTMLEKVADSYTKKRSKRVEPRVKKRRPKAYPLMQEPRHVLRAKLLSA